MITQLAWIPSPNSPSTSLPVDWRRFVNIRGSGAELAHEDGTGVIFEVAVEKDAIRLQHVLSHRDPRNVVIYDPTGVWSMVKQHPILSTIRVTRNLDDLEAAMNEMREGTAAQVRVTIESGIALIGVSPAIKRIEQEIAQVANHRCNLLVEGETGTGKEVVAKATHASGSRRRGPWIAVNCGAIPESLLEAELFGHVKGAFTGAIQMRIGKFEAANQGTIFLDEIGDMPLSTQGRLLRVIQEREIERLGGNERIPLDVRVIAATNVNLAERVRQGTFRQDLFYRLNVFRIAIPPLRERKEDIIELANHFLTKICTSEQLTQKVLDQDTIRLLQQHSWPGNVRELENCVERAVILSGFRKAIHQTDIRIDVERQGTGELRVTTADKMGSDCQPSVALPLDGIDYQRALEEFEKNLLDQALTRTHGNKTAAADLLGLKRTTLAAKMRVLESRRPRMVA